MTRALSAAVGITLLALFATLFTAPSEGVAQTGSITLSTDSGPVGTVVTISGTGCANAGQATTLSFQGGFDLSGTLGAAGIANIPTDVSGTFATTFNIPSELGSYQGLGGGPVVAGGYRFVSHPPLCIAYFTVTAPESLPQTGDEPKVSGVNGMWVPLAIGLTIVLFGVIVLRLAYRPPASDETRSNERPRKG